MSSDDDTPPSTKPYLIRALYDWCVDGGYTPHILVRVDGNTQVPRAYVRDGQIVLNIAPHATQQLRLGNEEITCQARFGGVAQSLFVPIANVMAIYARENGQGMEFATQEQVGTTPFVGTQAPETSDDEPPTDPTPEKPSPGRSHLRVIK